MGGGGAELKNIHIKMLANQCFFYIYDTQSIVRSAKILTVKANTTIIIVK